MFCYKVQAGVKHHPYNTDSFANLLLPMLEQSYESLNHCEVIRQVVNISIYIMFSCIPTEPT